MASQEHPPVTLHRRFVQITVKKLQRHPKSTSQTAYHLKSFPVSQLGWPLYKPSPFVPNYLSRLLLGFCVWGLESDGSSCKETRLHTYLDISDNLISKREYLIWFSCCHINCWHQIRDISTFLEALSPSVTWMTTKLLWFAAETKITSVEFLS